MTKTPSVNYDAFSPPPPDKSKWIWRYMDLTKFINLLSTQRLFIPVCTKFDDDREGLYTHPTHARMDHFLQKIREKNGDQKNSEDLRTSAYDRNREQIKIKRNMLVTCWNRSPDESVALWNMYPAGNNGVCIRSNTDIVSEEITKTLASIRFGNVKYESLYLKNEPSELFFRKQSEYAFESEFRGIVDITRENHFTHGDSSRIDSIRDAIEFVGGYPVPVSLENLITEIRVHYKAPKWVVDDIKSVVEKFGLPPGLVQKSSLHS